MRLAYKLLAVTLLAISGNYLKAEDILVEAESFDYRGGWVADAQYMDFMGSPYLLAHGMGEPVIDAQTAFKAEEPGEYHIFVRTFNWTSPWYRGEGPGKFELKVNGKGTGTVLGAEGDGWFWQHAGTAILKRGMNLLQLHDLTGFDGRADAIYLSKSNSAPPSDIKELDAFRKNLLGIREKKGGRYDLIVTGGGIAGISAAISAARLGLKVALIHNRPVLGGNNSSEVRVHLGGQVNVGDYPELGNLVKEMGPAKGGNARPASYYEDDKKMGLVLAEPNISLFLNYHAHAVDMKKGRISAVHIKNTLDGEELVLKSGLFADCTGDGTLGYLAGADFAMGREARSEYNESRAPEVPDKMTMGASVQWYSAISDKATVFPEFSYGLAFDDSNSYKVFMGEWTWETGMNMDQIFQAERIRDYGLMVIYSNWSWMKNHSAVKEIYSNRRLEWVAYVAGKRESRRLLGDHILTENDITGYVVYPDASAYTSWSIDLHRPNDENSRKFPGQEFISKAEHTVIHPYPIPYRCLYSRNVGNLFMAGRYISVTHVALGTIRVMRTTGMMGEVVGMAASLAAKNRTTPRGVYEKHLEDLKLLMAKGVGRVEMENIQTYNTGATLGDRK